MGGGIILDTSPARHRRGDEQLLRRLQQLEQKDPAELVLASLQHHEGEWPLMQELRVWTGMDEADLTVILQDLSDQHKIVTVGSGAKRAFLLSHSLAQFQHQILNALRHFHEKEPYRPGLNKAELRAAGDQKISGKLYEWLVAGLVETKAIRDEAGVLRLYEHRIELQARDRALADHLITILQESPFSPPSEPELVTRIGRPGAEVKRILNALQAMGDIVRLEGELYFTKKALNEMLQRLQQFSMKEAEISVSGFRELLGTSRKFAVPLLGYLDQKGITERVEDVRIIDRTLLQKAVQSD
jgi:selenocysteine-specific elongation factor